jgi:hypothetical protein
MEDRRVGRQPGATVIRMLSERPSGSAVLLAMVAMIAVATLVPPRCPASPVDGIAGWEGDGFDQGYGFAMAGVSFRHDRTISFPFHVSGSYLYYNYDEAGEVIRVSGPGGAALFGIRSTRPWGTLAAQAGGEIRWEKRQREPAGDAGASVARGGIVAQIEGELVWSRRLRPFLFANYSASARYFYGRAGLRWQISNIDWSGPLTWSLGLEGVGQGNADTDAVQGGVTVECSLARSRIALSVRGGYKNSASPDGGRRHGGYVGVGLYRRF